MDSVDHDISQAVGQRHLHGQRLTERPMMPPRMPEPAGARQVIVVTCCSHSSTCCCALSASTRPLPRPAPATALPTLSTGAARASAPARPR